MSMGDMRTMDDVRMSMSDTRTMDDVRMSMSDTRKLNCRSLDEVFPSALY